MVRFCRRLLEHANKGPRKGAEGHLLSVDIVCQAFAPIFLRPFGHAIHDEWRQQSKVHCNAKSAESRSGNKKAVLSPEDDGCSRLMSLVKANVFAACRL